MTPILLFTIGIAGAIIIGYFRAMVRKRCGWRGETSDHHNSSLSTIDFDSGDASDSSSDGGDGGGSD